MTTDPDLCRDILFKYADERQHPSDIDFEDLAKEFPKLAPGELEFNLMALEEAGLLVVFYERIATFDGVTYVIHSIDGLTPYKGSEFISRARKSNFWENAKKACTEQYGSVILGRMIEILMSNMV